MKLFVTRGNHGLIKRKDMTDYIGFLLFKCRWFRKWCGGTWYKHQSNGRLPGFYGSFWAKYGKINNFTTIIEIEEWKP